MNTKLDFQNNTSILLFLGLSLLIDLQLFSQEKHPLNSKDSLVDKSSFALQVNYEFGPIGETTQEVNFTDYNAFHIIASWKERSQNIYAHLYRNPRYGVGFYSGYIHNEIYGNPMAIYGFYEIPFHRKKSKWLWVYNIGLGLGFNFKHYDPLSNPHNEIIGSNRNFYVSFNFEGKYSFTPHWYGGFGVGLKHFSNGKMFLPNKGMNFVPITLSLGYQFHPNTFESIKPQQTLAFKPFNIFQVYGAIGHRNYTYSQGNYFKSTLSLGYLRQFSYKFRVGAGIEGFYSAGSLKRNQTDKSDFNKMFSYGVVGLFEWVITDRLYMPLNVGYHINRNVENDESKVYKRIGARYLFGKNKKLFAGVSLKVTETRSDYIEWTLGYTFKKDQNKYLTTH